jgi:murein DD-endopeptidase MepM/ murein hydrolase activator NlpD
VSSNPFDVIFNNPFSRVTAPPVPKSPAAATASVPAAGGDQLVGWLQKAGFKGEGLKTAWAIAKRESSGRPDAYNPDRSTGDDSYGLFQINMLGNLGPSRRASYGLKSNKDLLDPETNARVAYAMSHGGQDFGAWGIGPNAYRKMPALDFSGFPGGLAQTLPYKVPSTASRIPAAPAAPAFRELANFGMGGGEANPFAGLFASPVPQKPGAAPAQGHATLGGEKLAPVNLPKGVVNTTTYTGHGTHVTDGLDLNAGQKTAVDIMAHPGTAVAAPANGVVLRLGSAQGGQSMYFKDDQGYVWWLGHIDGNYSLPQGTRVRAGQTLSRVSADHANPHLHLDRTLSPTNRFG